MNEKQKRLRNQFVLPNEIFDLGLSGGEILVYAFLIRCEDRKTYTCYPSYDTIGSACGMSRNTVGKYVSLLEQKGLIRTEPTFFTSKDGKKRNGNLCFRILPFGEVLDARFRNQLARANTERRLQEYDRKHPRKEAT
ncbi:MAG: helix-turn-helix domain-containing protein [Clostridia bacterium]|nr:helix-turn-helix domain-containing protein [Clostridia bacterium]